MTAEATKCPSCKREVLTRDQNRCFPFCSDRCKAIDLGKWLGGEYRIAVKSEDEDDDGDSKLPPTDA